MAYRAVSHAALALGALGSAWATPEEQPVLSDDVLEESCKADDEGCSERDLSLRQLRAISISRHTMYSSLQAEATQSVARVSAGLTGAHLSLAAAPGASDECRSLAKELNACAPEDAENMEATDISKMCACHDVIEKLNDECPEYKSQLQSFYNDYQSVCSPCGEPFSTLVLTKECASDEGLKVKAACGDTCRPLVCKTIASCPKGAKAPGNTEDVTTAVVLSMEKTLKDSGCGCVADDAKLSFMAVANLARTSSGVASGAAARSVHKVSRAVARVTVAAGKSSDCKEWATELNACSPEDADKMQASDVGKMCACSDVLGKLNAQCPEYKKQLASFYDDFQSVCSACGEPFSTLVLTKACASDDGLKVDAACDTTCRPLICETITGCPKGAAAPGNSAEVTEMVIKSMIATQKDAGCASCPLEVNQQQVASLVSTRSASAASSGVAAAARGLRKVYDSVNRLTLLEGVADECSEWATELNKCAPEDADEMSAADVGKMCGCSSVLDKIRKQCPKYKKQLDSFYGDFQAVCSTCGEPFSTLVLTKECATDEGLKEKVACSDKCLPLICKTITGCPEGATAPGNSKDVTRKVVNSMNETLQENGCSCHAKKEDAPNEDAVAQQEDVPKEDAVAQPKADAAATKEDVDAPEEIGIALAAYSRSTTVSSAKATMRRNVQEVSANVGRLSLLSVGGGSSDCNGWAQELNACRPKDGDDMQSADVSKICGCSDVLDKLNSECPEYKKQLATFYADFKTVCSACGKPFSMLVLTKDCVDDEGLKESASCGDTCRPLICQAIAGCPHGAQAPGNSAEVTELVIKSMRQELKDFECTCSAKQAVLVSARVGSASSSKVAVSRKLQQAYGALVPTSMLAAPDGESASCQKWEKELKECSPEDGDDLKPADVAKMCGCKDTVDLLFVNCPTYRHKSGSAYDDYQSVCSTCGEPFSTLIMTDECSGDGVLKEGVACDKTCKPLVCATIAGCPKGSMAPGNSKDVTELFVQSMAQAIEDDGCECSAKQAQATLLSASVAVRTSSAFRATRVAAAARGGQEVAPATGRQSLLQVGGGDDPDCKALADELNSCAPKDVDEMDAALIGKMCGCSDTLEKVHNQCPEYKKQLAAFYTNFQSVCSACGRPFSTLVFTKECAGDMGLKEDSVCSTTCQPLICGAIAGCPKGAEAPGNSANVTAMVVESMDMAVKDGGCGCK